LQERFAELLPRKPYGADDFPDLRILTRPHALRRRHIQFNPPAVVRWMLHDIDDPSAYFAHRDANLPPPNIIIFNPANGHAHSAYLLASPVARHSAARLAPLRFFAAVERGIARRLGADRQYRGLIAKNPLHADWRVEWRRHAPYTLEELADWLFPRDMAPDPSPAAAFALGRNCCLFDQLRAVAYQEARTFKADGALDAFRWRLEHVALAINQQFSAPLAPREVRAIVKSVTKWTWKRFDEESFSRLQAERGRRGAAKRWAGRTSAEHTKPWQVEGISRRTWYRRRALERLVDQTPQRDVQLTSTGSLQPAVPANDPPSLAMKAAA
jgi:hypothetical protein